MQKIKSIKFNFIMNVLLTISSVIFPLITFPYISRILLPEGTGIVSFATSIVAYFCMFAQLGIPTYGVRICAQVRDDKDELSKVVQELFIINLITTVVSYSIFYICIDFIPKMQCERKLFCIIGVSMFLNFIGVEWLYKGLEQYTYITIRSVLFKFIALLMMFVLIHCEKDYVIYGGITIFASSASNILNFFNSRKYINFKVYKHYNLKRHIKPILTFFAMSFAITIYTNLDTVMLGFFKSNTEVGMYNAAIKIKGVLLGIVTSLGTVLLPRASYYIEHGLYNKFIEISKKAISFVFLVSIPLWVYFTIFAKEGILFLSGREYMAAIWPMKVIMPTLLFVGLTNLMGIQMLVPIGKEIYVLYSEIAGAVVNLIINYLLIPKYASIGASIGTTIAEITVWIVQIWALKDIVQKAYKEVPYKKIIGATLGAIVCSVIVKKIIYNLNVFIILLISSAVFLGIYVFILIVLKEQLTLEIRAILLNLILKRKRAK